MRSRGIFDAPLRQPDPRSCGAACLVVARMLRDPSYAARARLRFDEECLAMHRRTTGAVDVRGRLQPPWPRALGTPPWAVARQLAWTTGVRYRSRMVTGPGLDQQLARATAAVRAGLPVALYVGSRRLPRHVVLLVDAGPGERLTAYEPGSGELVRFVTADLREGRVRLGGWRRPWFVVSPADALPRHPATR